MAQNLVVPTLVFIVHSLFTVIKMVEKISRNYYKSIFVMKIYDNVTAFFLKTLSL